MINFVRGPCDNLTFASGSTGACQRYHEKWVLIATILGSSMAFIDGTIVNIALPAIQDALRTSINQMQWIIEAYALTLGTLLLIGGALGDLYGRRKIFLIGVVIFSFASIWCGVSSTISSLITARALQGVGAALLVPGSLALISTSFPEERRGQAIGTWAGFTSITTAAGPVVGGWLVQHLSWRWAFFLNLPLAIIVFIVTLIAVTESRNENQPKKLDLEGALLATIGLGAIVFGLIEWEKGTSMILLSLISGLCALIIFLLVEAHASFPIVPLELFRSRNFSGANLITFFLYFALYGVLFFLPLDLIQVKDYTPTEAGAALLPLILLIFLLSRWAGGLIKKYGPKLPLIVGPAIASLGFALFLRSGIQESYWVSLFPAMIVLGFGMAVSIAPLTTVVMNSVPANHVGIASGINNAIARIAGLLAVAALGLIMAVIFNHQLEKLLNVSTFPVTIKQDILKQSSLLADIKTNNESARTIVKESFITGYEVIILIATVMSFASSLFAGAMISGKLNDK